MTKKKILGLSILGISLAWLFLGSSKPASDQAFLASVPIDIEIAQTPNQRIRGLSGRASLPAQAGLLFVFDSPGRHGIWMKDMEFAIDIAWLDQDKKIIHLEENISPETFPKVFYPPSEALYVLEVNAGFFATHKIKIGQTLETKDFWTQNFTALDLYFVMLILSSYPQVFIGKKL